MTITIEDELATEVEVQDISDELMDEIKKAISGSTITDDMKKNSVKLAGYIYGLALNNPIVHVSHDLDLRLETFWIVLRQLSDEIGLKGTWVTFGGRANSSVGAFCGFQPQYVGYQYNTGIGEYGVQCAMWTANV